MQPITHRAQRESFARTPSPDIRTRRQYTGMTAIALPTVSCIGTQKRCRFIILAPDDQSHLAAYVVSLRTRSSSLQFSRCLPLPSHRRDRRRCDPRHIGDGRSLPQSVRPMMGARFTRHGSLYRVCREDPSRDREGG